MTESYESVTFEIKDHVAQVTLIGPGKGNAMGPAFWSELPVVFSRLDEDRDVRAIVLTGSGKNFSYGLDLAAMGGTMTPMLAEGRWPGRGRISTVNCSACRARSPRSPTAALRRSPRCRAGASAVEST